MEHIYSACCTTLLIYSSVSRRKEDANTTLRSRCSSCFYYFAAIWDIRVHMCVCATVRLQRQRSMCFCFGSLPLSENLALHYLQFFFSVFLFFFGLVSAFPTFFSQNSFSGSCRSVWVIQNPAKAGKPLPLLFLFCFIFTPRFHFLSSFSLSLRYALYSDFAEVAARVAFAYSNYHTLRNCCGPRCRSAFMTRMTKRASTRDAQRSTYCRRCAPTATSVSALITCRRMPTSAPRWSMCASAPAPYATASFRLSTLVKMWTRRCLATSIAGAATSHKAARRRAVTALAPTVPGRVAVVDWAVVPARAASTAARRRPRRG